MNHVIYRATHSTFVIITDPPSGASIVLLAGVCCMSSSSVGVCNAAGGRAGRPPGAWAVGGRAAILQGGPVRLRPVRVKPRSGVEHKPFLPLFLCRRASPHFSRHSFPVLLNKGKGKEAYLYSAFYILCITQSAQAWITQFYLQIHHACLSFVCVYQMAPLSRWPSC